MFCISLTRNFFCLKCIFSVTYPSSHLTCSHVYAKHILWPFLYLGPKFETKQNKTHKKHTSLTSIPAPRMPWKNQTKSVISLSCSTCPLGKYRRMLETMAHTASGKRVIPMHLEHFPVHMAALCLEKTQRGLGYCSAGSTGFQQLYSFMKEQSILKKEMFRVRLRQIILFYRPCSLRKVYLKLNYSKLGCLIEFI